MNAGDQVVYTLLVTNHGPANGDDALVQDPAVPGLSCSEAPTCAVPAGSSAVCPAAPISIGDLQGTGIAIPSLPVGSSVELGLTCTVD